MASFVHIVLGSITAGLPLVSIELLSRYRALPAELGRKSTHLFSTLSVVLLLSFCHLGEIAVIGVVFTGILLATRRMSLWQSLYKVKRRSWGEVIFPAGVTAAALLASSETAFAMSMLFLGFGDTLASLVGQHYGRRRLPIFKSKTWLGSIACLVTCYIIGAAFVGHLLSLPVISLAIIVTMAEVIGWQGLDNILIPLVTVIFIKLINLQLS